MINKEMEEEMVQELMAPRSGGINRMLDESLVVAEKRSRLKKSVKLLKESKEVVSNIMDRISYHGGLLTCYFITLLLDFSFSSLCSPGGLRTCYFITLFFRRALDLLFHYLVLQEGPEQKVKSHRCSLPIVAESSGTNLSVKNLVVACSSWLLRLREMSSNSNNGFPFYHAPEMHSFPKFECFHESNSLSVDRLPSLRVELRSFFFPVLFLGCSSYNWKDWS
ncbi:hypothetical protein CQW23_24554 [Capsicum baccatum]|uniref:GED domain-containing protein n=1 Tax=Capsicum baccatum TaxID=33114 RepID=A0A2G2VV64_CAPBA|nr:hypothetical protein CQW23_24554 [Capsicum baccatum]